MVLLDDPVLMSEQCSNALKFEVWTSLPRDLRILHFDIDMSANRMQGQHPKCTCFSHALTLFYDHITDKHEQNTTIWTLLPAYFLPTVSARITFDCKQKRC